MAPLSGDEAYYWLWGWHPALGYYDHPPMVGWLVAVPLALHLSSPFWLRLPFVAMGAALPWIWGQVAYRIAPGSASTTRWFVLFLPYVSLQATTATPDTPLLFFLSLAALAWAEQRLAWAGLALGLALISKFMAVLWLPFLLRRRGLGPMLLALSPYLAWNATHGWEPFHYQLHARHLIEHHPTGLLSYIGMQAAAAGPALLYLAVRASRRGSRWLAALGWTPLLFFAVFAFHEYVEIYWPQQAWLPLAALVAAYPLSRGWKAAVVAPGALVAALLLLGSAAPTLWVRLATLGKPADFPGNEVTELQAYPQLGRDLRDFPGMIVTDHYGRSSAIWYYSGHPTCTLPISLRGREYRRWEQETPGQDAVYVGREPLSQRPDVLAMLQASFTSVDAPVPVRYEFGGRPARVFWEARCHRLVHPF